MVFIQECRHHLLDIANLSIIVLYTSMKRYISVIIISLAFFLSAFAHHAHAALTFGDGYYTSLCGTGTAATANTCNKGCDPTKGICMAEKPFVIKWTCNGNVSECRQNESAFAVTQNIGATTCGQTVLMQVYNRNCRSYFGWICSETNLLDSMTWYSGDCQGNSTASPSVTVGASPTSSVANTLSSCEELTVTKGNNGTVPGAVTFKVDTSAGSTATSYRYYFGDGTNTEVTSPTTTHTYTQSGSFVARVETKDTDGIWTGSPRCETQVVIKSSSLETQKSDCSDLFIIDGNGAAAPATVSVRVTGYDNKGLLKKYSISSPESQAASNDSGAFQITFNTPGTYVLRGSVTDSAGVVKYGTGGTCEKTVMINSGALTVQPNTGTPTWMSLAAILSGIAGFIILMKQSPSLAKREMKRTHKKRKTKTP